MSWGKLKNYFQRLWRRETNARKTATPQDSHLSNRDFLTADWARLQQKAQIENRKALQDAFNRRKALDELHEQIEREEELRALKRSFDSAIKKRALPPYLGGGTLAPLPSSNQYGGDVPNTATYGESALWIMSGKFHIINHSGNVYAIAYDVRRGCLYVQYKHWRPGLPFGAQNGPGPIYEYKNVSISEAHAIFRAPDVSAWLWDNVRRRGTWSGHKKPYRLVAIQAGYLPRKATFWRGGQEWFIRRQMWGVTGQATYSQLPNAPAPPMGYDGKPIRTTDPNRGRPNNGRPFNGRPNNGWN